MTASKNVATDTRRQSWLPIKRYDLALQRDALWHVAGNGIEQRDLGLAGASNGAMQARQLRSDRGEAELASWQGDGTPHFHMLYVIEGSVSLRAADDSLTFLNAGDCVHQPALAKRYRVTLSGGAQVLEFVVPVPPSHGGKSFELVSGEQAAQLAINRDLPTAYVRGDGPRSYFLYRDLGVAAATDRRIHMHVLKATAPSQAGGTGEHRHSMCQLFYVFSGWADLEAEGQQTVRMHGGDAMCIAAGMRHNVPAFSAEYAILEVCIPADYDTVDV